MDLALERTVTGTSTTKMAPNHLLRQAREEKCFSQEELAERLGTTQVTISRWERGLTNPSPYYRRKLCAHFDKTPATLGLLPQTERPRREQEAPQPSNRTSPWAYQPAVVTLPLSPFGCEPQREILVRGRSESGLSAAHAPRRLPSAGKTPTAIAPAKELAVQPSNGSLSAPNDRIIAWTARAAHDEHVGDRATTRQAHAEASQAYHACIRRWDTLGEVAHAAGAREKLGAALMSNARYDEALDVLLGAASIYRAQGDHERLFHTLARIGEAHALRGTPDEGLVALAPVAELKAGVVAAGTLASAKIALAWLINCTGRYADALPVAASALELASSTRDTALRMRAALRHGHLLLMLGDLDEGTRSLREVMPVAEQSADLRSLRLACNSLGWIHELRGEQAEDRVHTERAYQAALALGDPSVIAFMMSNRGGPAFHSGDWVAARADFECGLELSRAIGTSWGSPWSVLLLGQLDLIQGQDTRGEQRLAEALALAERSGDLQALRWAHSTLAERDLLRGVAEAAHRRLTPLVGHACTHEVDEQVLLPLYAWVAIEKGHLSRATNLLEPAITYAGANHLIPTLITALRVRATLRQRQGNIAQAEDDLRQALALSEQVKQPYHVAKVLLTWADVAARQADVTSARERSRAALQLLQPLGERLYAAVAEQMLA